MSDDNDYTAREGRLIRERDAALTRAENAEAEVKQLRALLATQTPEEASVYRFRHAVIADAVALESATRRIVMQVDSAIGVGAALIRAGLAAQGESK